MFVCVKRFIELGYFEANLAAMLITSTDYSWFNKVNTHLDLVTLHYQFQIKLFVYWFEWVLDFGE